MPRHNILIIANRRSGTGSADSLEKIATQVLQHAGAKFTLVFTQAPGHATALARDGIREGFTTVVAAGGDGTVNEVARAMTGSSPAMGIIPRGSGNGLARHLGIPLALEKALACLVEGEPVGMDTFTLNDRLSLNVSGIGFDAHIAALFSHSRRRGLLNYARLALSEYGKFPTFDTSLDASIASPRHRGVFLIAVANSSQYGNNARIAPGSSVCDGKLTVNLVSRIPMYRLDAVWSLFRGNVANKKWCATFETEGVTIYTDRKVAYHVDGEPCGVDDTFVIRVKPLSLRMIIPKGKVV
jgi:YegS/Rv2252/BmrU family lipid kinase